MGNLVSKANPHCEALLLFVDAVNGTTCELEQKKGTQKTVHTRTHNSPQIPVDVYFSCPSCCLPPSQRRSSSSVRQDGKFAFSLCGTRKQSISRPPWYLTCSKTRCVCSFINALGLDSGGLE